MVAAAAAVADLDVAGGVVGREVGLEARVALPDAPIERLAELGPRVLPVQERAAALARLRAETPRDYAERLIEARGWERPGR